MSRLTIWLTALLVAWPATRSLAQERFDPAAAAEAVAPYVDEQTLAVAHIDLRRIDFVAGRRFLVEVMNVTPEETAQLEAGERTLRQWTEQLQQAGGGELYAIVSLAHLNARVPFLIVAPIAPNGDPDKAIALLKQTLGERRWTFQKAPGVVLAGSPETLQEHPLHTPVARPNLATAMAAAGDAPIRLAVIPTRDMRRVIREMLPPLPAELGGAGGAQLADSMIWLAAAVQPPPEMSVRLVSQAEDPQAAAALRQTLAAALRQLARQPQVRRVIADPEKLAEQLTPRVEDDRLVLSLDPTTGAAQLVHALVAPALAAARETARRQRSQSNLKQIGIALHNYHDVAKRFPPQASAAPDGKKLLSWRVQLLPYLDQQELYNQFRHDEPWDSPHNRALIERMPDVFASPYLSREQRAGGKTSYLAPIAPGTVFGGEQGTRIQEITDGTSNTILVLEVPPASAVEWTKPEDWTVDLKAPLEGLTGRPTGGFSALFADASVRFIAQTVDPEVLRRLFQMNDGQPINLPRVPAPQQDQPQP